MPLGEQIIPPPVFTGAGTLPSTAVTGLTSQQVLYGSSVGGIQQDADLVYDSTVNTLTIGTTVTQGGLSVGTTSVISGGFTLSRAVGSGPSFIRLTNSVGGGVQLRGAISQSTDNDFAITNITGGTEFLRINSSGHVGIGTTTPTVPLDVVGNVRLGGTTAFTIGFFGAAGSTLASSYTTAAVSSGRTFASTAAASTGNFSTFTGVSGAGCAFNTRATMEAFMAEFNNLARVVETMAKDLGVAGGGYGLLR